MLRHISGGYGGRFKMEGDIGQFHADETGKVPAVPLERQDVPSAETAVSPFGCS